MENSFTDLGISQPILKGISKMGFKIPTEVQSRAIPHVLDNKDLIVMSKTGSGKTAAFGVPILQNTKPEKKEPQSLILTPTRELAVQVNNHIKGLGRYLSHKTIAVYGKHSIKTEIYALKKGASIVTGTPGRVLDHIKRRTLKTRNIRYLVVDEADRMLDMGFIKQVTRIIKALPKQRITLLLSATITPKIHQICENYMNNPKTIEIGSETKTVDSINQSYYRVQKNKKQMWLNRLLLMEQPESCLIFCNTRLDVKRVRRSLTKRGYACYELHGGISQKRRLRTMRQFKKGDFNLLVATDVAARGIDIDNLSLVINYDVPVRKDSYIHRIGRTGRIGKKGRAVTFVTGDDLMDLYEIEEHTGAMIPESKLPDEKTFKKYKSKAYKWKQSNTRIKKSNKSNKKTRYKKPKKKRSYKKPYKSHKSHKKYKKYKKPAKVNNKTKPNTKPSPKPVPSKPEPKKTFIQRVLQFFKK